MSVRFETKFFWSIDKKREIYIGKTENDLAENAVYCAIIEDGDILSFAFCGTEGGAKGESDYVLGLINSGKKVDKDYSG